MLWGCLSEVGFCLTMLTTGVVAARGYVPEGVPEGGSIVRSCAGHVNEQATYILRMTGEVSAGIATRAKQCDQYSR